MKEEIGIYTITSLVPGGECIEGRLQLSRRAGIVFGGLPLFDLAIPLNLDFLSSGSPSHSHPLMSDGSPIGFNLGESATEP